MRLIAYYPSWSIYERACFFKDIPLDSLTHLTLAFAIPESNGNLNTEELEKLDIADLRRLGGEKLKVGIAVGGWGTCEEFSAITQSEQGRRQFIEKCLDLVARFDLDYFEIDWEYPANTEQGNHLKMILAALREHLPSNKQLSICLPCFKNGFVSTEIVQFIDFFILMGYDMCGSWSERSGHHSALNPNISNHIKYLYEEEGIPLDKIVLGCPLYGRSFAGCSGPDKVYTGPGLGSFGEEGSMDYKDIIAKCKETMYDPEKVSHHATWQDNFVSFEGPESMKTKCDWVLERGIGGVAFWNAASDANGKDSLIRLTAGFLNLPN